MMTDRLMPDAYRLGNHCATTVAHAIDSTERERASDIQGRKVLGFRLPTWQRPLVWTEGQMIRFLESLWLGIPVGTYTYVQNSDPATDGLLIDGQQRMYALERYLADAFTVFGYRWSEVTEIDRRALKYSRSFPCYITTRKDETFLRNYYNLMNFAGTQHKESERA